MRESELGALQAMVDRILDRIDGELAKAQQEVADGPDGLTGDVPDRLWAAVLAAERRYREEEAAYEQKAADYNRRAREEHPDDYDEWNAKETADVIQLMKRAAQRRIDERKGLS